MLHGGPDQQPLGSILLAFQNEVADEGHDFVILSIRDMAAFLDLSVLHISPEACADNKPSGHAAAC
ncbi:hypothetical protein D3C75_853840 [compost metagenome]